MLWLILFFFGGYIMNSIKQALTSLVKINVDKDTAPTETAKTLALSEMKDIKIESITFEDSIKTSYYYRIYFKSEDDQIHRINIDESLFNVLFNAYEWMEIDRNEHTTTDPDTGYVAKEINSIMIAVVPNNKD